MRRRLSGWRGGLALCVVVGVCNALAWSVINPYGYGPDEFPHIALVDYVADARTYPSTGGGFAGEVGLLWHGQPFSISGYPSWSVEHERYVREDLRRHPKVQLPPAYVTNNPPLYYVIAAVPTEALRSVSLFDRIWVMRLVSSLLCGLLAGLCFLFVRELFPRHPWAWTVGGLVVALQPLVAFLGGAVSPDNVLFPSAAGMFYFLARAFRRGLTPANAAGLGFAALCGCLSKGTTFGLLPGAAFGALAAAWLHRRERGPVGSVAPLGVGFATFAVPFGAWLWANTNLLERPASTTTSGVSPRGDSMIEFLGGLASYTWQQFLPRLPFMQDQLRRFFPPQTEYSPPFPAFPQYPLWQTYLEGFVGRFSYFEYSFPVWVDVFAAFVYLVLGGLAARATWQALRRSYRRRPELVTYLLMAAGVFMVVTLNGYVYRHDRAGINFEQTRYVVPLIPLYAAVVSAACISLARWARPVVGVVVVLATGHALAALLMTLERYYAG